MLIEIKKFGTTLEGVYTCGDRYYYPLIETSLVAAKKAIEMILKR